MLVTFPWEFKHGVHLKIQIQPPGKGDEPNFAPPTMDPWKKCKKPDGSMEQVPLKNSQLFKQKNRQKKIRANTHRTHNTQKTKKNVTSQIFFKANQKTVALLPKSLPLDPRFPVFLQGFLAGYPP